MKYSAYKKVSCQRRRLQDPHQKKQYDPLLFGGGHKNGKLMDRVCFVYRVLFIFMESVKNHVLNIMNWTVAESNLIKHTHMNLLWSFKIFH